jgi:hypothetical protein
MKLLIMQFSVNSCLLDPESVLSTLFSNSLNPCTFLILRDYFCIPTITNLLALTLNIQATVSYESCRSCDIQKKETNIITNKNKGKINKTERRRKERKEIKMKMCKIQHHSHVHMSMNFGLVTLIINI